MDSDNMDSSCAQLDYALEAARMGYKVFPCRADSKTPLVKQWETEATTDIAKITAWWTKWRDANIGAAVGASDVTVLDVDVRDNKAGKDNLALLEQPDVHSLPRSRVALTPSGGFHIHMAGRTSSRTGLLNGLDIRSVGGYVLMPGSWINGRPYKWHKDGGLRPAPDWFLDLAGSPKAKPTHDEPPPNGWDHPADTSWARDFLSNDAPIAIEGDGGDDRTYQIACILRDRGISPEKAVELMGELYNPRCAPPWPMDDGTNTCLKAKIENAYRYAIGPAGDLSIASDFNDRLPELEAEVVRRKRFAELTITELSNVTAPKWLVDGLIPDQGLAVVYGQPKAGKTFWALDLSLSVAHGRQFHGIDTRPGRVTYVAAEGGPARLNDRVQAWLRAREIAEGAAAAWGLVASRVDLTSASDVKQFADSLDGARDLIVIDTLARCMSGDENSQKDMNAFVQGCDYLRVKTGAAVLVIHHEGKDPGRGARGSNVLRGAWDTSIRLKRETDGGITAIIEDQRDGSGEEPMHFELRNVPLGGIENASAALFVTKGISNKGISPLGDMRILKLAAAMDGQPKKDLDAAVANLLRCAASTARRQIKSVLAEGRDLARHYDGRIIWLSRKNPGNKQSGLVVRVDRMSDTAEAVLGESQIETVT